MIDKETLDPVEEKTILFYDDELTAVQLKGGDIFVPVRRLCENLGLVWSGQFERIQRDEVLNESLKAVRVTRTPLEPGGRSGGPQDTLCLPLDLVPGWLFGIQTGRVKEDIRPKLIRYRRECFRVLWDAFKDDVLPAMAPGPESPAGDLTPAEQNLVNAERIYQMAKQQVIYERWLTQHDHRLDLVEDTALAAHERLDKAAAMVGALQMRVYGPHQVISEAQAAQLAELVKHIAGRLGEQDPSKNHYQGVWGELHRRYGITTYRRVPADKFAEVVTWLESWLGTLASTE